MGAPAAFTRTDDVVHWIGGRATRGSGTRSQTVWNPASGAAARQVLLAGEADVAAAVAAARAAQQAWGDTPPVRRARRSPFSTRGSSASRSAVSVSAGRTSRSGGRCPTAA